MIIKDFYMTRADGVDLYQRRSDLGVKLLQVETGKTYDDPIDVEPCPYTYEETDIPVDEDSSELIEQDYRDALSELGVNMDE